MSDPRVEAVARIIRQADALPGNLTPSLDLYIGDAEQALVNADAADRKQGIHRVKVDDATVERCAEAAALVDDLDGCFEHIREWEALEEWGQEAQGYPSDDYEARADWIKRTRAVLAALTGVES